MNFLVSHRCEIRFNNVIGQSTVLVFPTQKFLDNADLHGQMSMFENLIFLTLSQTTISDFSKLKDVADDNCKFDENGRKFFKWVENTVRQGEIARYEQFLLFPQCSRDFNCRHKEHKRLPLEAQEQGLVWERVNLIGWIHLCDKKNWTLVDCCDTIL